MLVKITRWTIVLLFLLRPTPGQEPINPPQVDQDDIIRVETNLVQLRATVTDKNGRPVDGLKREDFQILENNRTKEIGSFSVDRTNGNFGNARESSAIGTSVRPNAAVNPARTVVLFVDTFHLSKQSFMRVKHQLRQLIADQITDRDLVAIVSPDGRLGALQQFTTDRKVLNYAIDRLSLFSRSESHFTPYLAARVTSEEQDAANAAIEILVAEESYQPTTTEAALSYVRARAREIIDDESYHRRATLQTLQAIADRLANMPGQRIVAVLSDGFTMLENGGGAANQETQAVIGHASRAGVVIYSLNPQGLMGPGEFSASSNLDGRSLIQVARYIRDSERDQKDILKTLAYDTGGEAYLNTNSLNNSFQKVFDANSVTYVLGYYAPSGPDGNFRNISVRLNNHSQYSVHSAKGYVPFTQRVAGTTQTPRQRLFTAMISPLPMTEIAVSSSADFLERSSDQARVSLTVNIDGQSLTFEPQAQGYRLRCEIAAAIYDGAGRLVKNFIDSVRVDLTAEQAESSRKLGFRYGTRLEVKPGTYQARVGARDPGSGLVGTSTSWVRVPDLGKAQLTLSSIFLGRSSSGEGRTDAKTKFVQARPVYKSDDSLFYRFVAYNVDSTDEAKVRIEILAGEKPTFTSEWRSLAERTLARDKKGTELGGEIRVRLNPGLYTLRATVVDTKSRKTAQQTIYFEVE